MNHTVGQLVEHRKFGLGKVLAVAGDLVTVFFKNVADNPKTIAVGFLQVSEIQSDPWLDNLDPNIKPVAGGHKHMTHEAAVERFLSIFPQGFHDPRYMESERNYKWGAHELWIEALGKSEFDRLLSVEEYDEITRRASQVEGRTNLLAVFEKAALHDAVKGSEAAKHFACGLYDLIHGADAFEPRFKRFVQVLDGLPQPKTQVAKWPIATIFPFLALPGEHLFLKPNVTQQAAKRRAFSLNYDPRPNWLTYSCLLKFGQILMEDLAELEPRDMIDIQSFIWVTGEGSYK